MRVAAGQPAVDGPEDFNGGTAQAVPPLFAFS